MQSRREREREPWLSTASFAMQRGIPGPSADIAERRAVRVTSRLRREPRGCRGYPIERLGDSLREDLGDGNEYSP